MTRLKAHLIGLCLIPVIWLVLAVAAVFAIAATLFVTIIITLALLIVPGQVKVNGTTLYRILRKAKS